MYIKYLKDKNNNMQMPNDFKLFETPRFRFHCGYYYANDESIRISI